MRKQSVASLLFSTHAFLHNTNLYLCNLPPDFEEPVSVWLQWLLHVISSTLALTIN